MPLTNQFFPMFATYLGVSTCSGPAKFRFSVSFGSPFNPATPSASSAPDPSHTVASFRSPPQVLGDPFSSRSPFQNHNQPKKAPTRLKVTNHPPVTNQLFPMFATYLGGCRLCFFSLRDPQKAAFFLLFFLGGGFPSEPQPLLQQTPRPPPPQGGVPAAGDPPGALPQPHGPWPPVPPQLLRRLLPGEVCELGLRRPRPGRAWAEIVGGTRRFCQAFIFFWGGGVMSWTGGLSKSENWVLSL